MLAHKKDSPASLGDFDSYSLSYDEAVNKAASFSGLEVDFFTRTKAGLIHRLLEQSSATAKSAAVLDVGCGIGNYALKLKQHVAAYAGVDVSKECVSVAARRYPDDTFRHFDGQNLPFGPGSFDFAFAVCVFHHVPTRMRASLAADVLRVLKPGGTFAIFEHNPRNPVTMRVVNRCEFDKDAILLDDKETVALMEGAGFEDARPRFLLTVPPKGRLLSRIDRWLSPLRIGCQFYVAAQKPC
jgi:SAM-dependent methyltransferase